MFGKSILNFPGEMSNGRFFETPTHPVKKCPSVEIFYNKISKSDSKTLVCLDEYNLFTTGTRDSACQILSFCHERNVQRFPQSHTNGHCMHVCMAS